MDEGEIPKRKVASVEAGALRLRPGHDGNTWDAELTAIPSRAVDRSRGRWALLFLVSSVNHRTKSSRRSRSESAPSWDSDVIVPAP